MTTPYAKHFNPTATPQSQPIPGREAEMIRNAAGGYVFEADRWQRLERFLILGSEGGTYYITEQALTVDNARNVIACVVENGLRAVDEIRAVSHAGRAPRNAPAVFALALAASYGDAATRAHALNVLPSVCRIPTDLFQFVEFVQQHRGWGRGLRRAIAAWYNGKELEQLVYHALKYKERNGWTHRDLLRLAHIKPPEGREELYRYLAGKIADIELPLRQEFAQIVGCNVAHDAVKIEGADRPAVWSRLIRELRLTREMLPTEALNEPAVWEALAEQMPLHALLRNLGNLTKHNVLAPFSAHVGAIVALLTSPEHLERARVHPAAVWTALAQYRQGHGKRGSSSWEPLPVILDALEAGFYAAFRNVRPTGKRILLGIDVSRSMGVPVAGIDGMMCYEGAALTAMSLVRQEPTWYAVAFDTRPHSLRFTTRSRIAEIERELQQTGHGGTNCAIPIQYALERDMEVDAFVILTDNETWQGSAHPSQVIAHYRQLLNKDAKLVVIAMAANRSNIGDPLDALTMYCVGLDAHVPRLVAEFIA